MIAARSEAENLDTDGLARLFLALRRKCECETGDARFECHLEPLDRWWVAVASGREADS